MVEHFTSVTVIVLILTFQVFVTKNSYSIVSPALRGIERELFFISHSGVGVTVTVELASISGSAHRSVELLAVTVLFTTPLSTSLCVIGIELQVYVHISFGDIFPSLPVSLLAVSNGPLLHFASDITGVSIVRFHMFSISKSYTRVSHTFTGVAVELLRISQSGLCISA